MSIHSEIHQMLYALGVAQMERAKPEREAEERNGRASSASTYYPPFYQRMKRKSRHGDPILLTGPAATGKSFAVHQYAAEVGAKVFTQQAYRTLSVEDIRGTRALKDMQTTFEPGLLARSLVHEHQTGQPAVYFIDEVNMADPGITALFHNLLDGSREITIPETGERITPSPGWRFFAAMNPGYEGTKELNQALKSRCVSVETDFFPPEIEARLIVDRFREAPNIEKIAEIVVSMAKPVREARAAGHHDFDLCLRTLFHIADDFLHGGDPLDAFKLNVLPKVGDPYTFGPQRQALLDVVEIVLSAKSKGRNAKN